MVATILQWREVDKKGREARKREANGKSDTRGDRHRRGNECVGVRRGQTQERERGAVICRKK